MALATYTEAGGKGTTALEQPVALAVKPILRNCSYPLDLQARPTITVSEPAEYLTEGRALA